MLDLVVVVEEGQAAERPILAGPFGDAGGAELGHLRQQPTEDVRVAAVAARHVLGELVRLDGAVNGLAQAAAVELDLLGDKAAEALVGQARKGLAVGVQRR